jgi:hypothetical protein
LNEDAFGQPIVLKTNLPRKQSKQSKEGKKKEITPKMEKYDAKCLMISLKNKLNNKNF